MTNPFFLQRTILILILIKDAVDHHPPDELKAKNGNEVEDRKRACCLPEVNEWRKAALLLNALPEKENPGPFWPGRQMIGD